MNVSFSRQHYRFVLLLLCTILLQQGLFSQVEIFLLPNNGKKDTFTAMEPAAKKWLAIKPRDEKSKESFTFNSCKRSESGSSVIVRYVRSWQNGAGEGGAEKPVMEKDDPTEETTSIEIETVEDLVKTAKEPVAAVVKESVASPVKETKAKAAKKPTKAENNAVAPLKVTKINQARTEPSRQPDELATARGRSDLEAGRARDAAPENVRAYENERPVADALAQAGYDVEFTEGRITPAEQAAEGIRATANPDLRVEGNIWDIYSPGPNTSAASAAAHTFDKVREPAGAQTRRVVVALDPLRITRTQLQEAMRRQIRQYGNFGMREIFAVQNGRIYRVYPF